LPPEAIYNFGSEIYKTFYSLIMVIKANSNLVQEGKYRTKMNNDLASLIQYGISLIKLIMISINNTKSPDEQVSMYSETITQTKLLLSENLKHLKMYRDECQKDLSG